MRQQHRAATMWQQQCAMCAAPYIIKCAIHARTVDRARSNRWMGTDHCNTLKTEAKPKIAHMSKAARTQATSCQQLASRLCATLKHKRCNNSWNRLWPPRFNSPGQSPPCQSVCSAKPG
jgi:hypothetical protein